MMFQMSVQEDVISQTQYKYVIITTFKNSDPVRLSDLHFYSQHSR